MNKSSQYQQNIEKYLLNSRPIETIHTYLVKSSTANIYCKLKRYILNGYISYTISFGGNKQYCVVMSGRSKSDETLDELYLDRVEYNSKCSKGEDLLKSAGTKSLLKSALWFVKLAFSSLAKVHFMDDSHIYCNSESTQYRLPLACDYVVKYNQTWYQAIFHAELEPTLMTAFENSIKKLDEPLEPLQIMIERGASYLQDFTEEYIHSHSPREFLQTIRSKYGNESYCYKVSPWLARYFQLLRIMIYKNNWYIQANKIEIPMGYSHEETKNILHGGKRNKTYKLKKYRYSFLPNYEDMLDSNGYMGTIDDYNSI